MVLNLDMVLTEAKKNRVRSLRLNHRGIEDLPRSIGSLTTLAALHLQLNQISELPTEIGRLDNLLHLDLSGNDLTALPTSIGHLGRLQTLQLNRNKLTELPERMSRLSNLRTLDLEDNRLTHLPPELGRLFNLQELRVSGNPLVSPPQEVALQGTRAILTYLRENLRASRQQWTSKLLFVGEGGVGKTSLLRSLKGESFDPQQSTTHGIEIRKLGVSHPTLHGTQMNLTCWDFGGQEIYHATHQFFLTDKSLFMLVWNARQGFEQGKPYYWLDTIRALAPRSPVLLVATHGDQRDAEIPIKELSKEYPQIVGAWQVSNLNSTGIGELADGIAHSAASLPLMGERWPSRWLDAAEDIRSRPEKYISPTELRNCMQAHDVEDDEISILTQWLHELGDLLYFHHDDELRDVVILQPEWVSGYISRVLESTELIASKGVLTREHMNHLWSDLEEGLRSHFLRLMEKFDLSYRTLENRDISLIVERLPVDAPNYDDLWNAPLEEPVCREISMKYRLRSVPAGIPTWFIARAHRFTTYTHWRSGTVFADGHERQHLALVRVSHHEKDLRLSVRGPSPHNFFALLRDGIELTLARFPGLETQRLIPCPGHDGKPCAHEFDFAHLEQAISKKGPGISLQCPVSLEGVSVIGLLFGLNWRAEDAVLQKLEELKREQARRDRELVALLQREFAKAFHRRQSLAESHCPSVFVLRPAEGNKWRRDWMGSRVELQLYCEAPGNWHPAGESGRYTLDRPPEWIKAAAPYVRRVARILRYVAPVAGSALGVVAPELAETMKNDIRLVQDLVKVLPVSAEEADLTEGWQAEEATRQLSGATLRVLRQFLESQDPSHYWGGLSKILTPEGHYLWLCDEHAAEYKN